MGKRATYYGVGLGLLLCVWVASRSTIIWLLAHAETQGEKAITAILPFPLPVLCPSGSITVSTDMLEKAGKLSLLFPWYLLVSLGCYCLFRLGKDLLSFRNCPEEVKKLEDDIVIARADLKKRGLK